MTSLGSGTDGGSDRLLRRGRWLVAACVVALAAAVHYPIPYDNVEVRWLAARAIVEHGTFAIDDFEHGHLLDKAIVGDHVYSDKAPGLQVAAALVLAPLAWLQRALGIPIDDATLRYVVQLLVVALPGAVLAVLLVHALVADGLDSRRALVLGLAAVAATPVLPYCALLYSHVPVACLAFAALLVAVPADRPARPRDAWLAGALLGAAMATEYPAVLAAVGIGVVVLATNPRGAVRLVGGACPAAIAVLCYHRVVFGHPFATGYAFHAEPHLREAMAVGVGGVSLPSLHGAYTILASPARGLAYTAPVLVLAFPGAVAWARSGSRPARLAAAALVAVLFGLFNAAYSLPDGGWACGPRHLIPAIPFAALLAGRAVRGPAGTAALVALGMVGLARSIAAMAIDLHVPEDVVFPPTEWWLPMARLGHTAGLPIGAWPLMVAAAPWAAFAVTVWPRRAVSRPHARAWGIGLAVLVVAVAMQARVGPEPPTLALTRAQVLVAHDRPAAARAACSAALASHPDDVELWLLYLELSRDAGDEVDAIRRAHAAGAAAGARAVLDSTPR